MTTPPEPASALVEEQARQARDLADAAGLVVTVLTDGSLNVAGPSEALRSWRRAEALAIAALTLKEAGL